MQIFILKDGQQFGPYTIDQVNQFLSDGGFSPSQMAWYDGAQTWIPLASVPGVVILKQQVLPPSLPPVQQLPNKNSNSVEKVLWRGSPAFTFFFNSIV